MIHRGPRLTAPGEEENQVRGLKIQQRHVCGEYFMSTRGLSATSKMATWFGVIFAMKSGCHVRILDDVQLRDVR